MILTFSQSNPLKKGWFFISWIPFDPNLSLTSHNNLLRISVASGDNFASSGIDKVFLHYKIFWHVTLGSSEKNGGYPTSISNKIAPHDHQSTVSLYPYYPKTSGAI